jgi:hypothetical protein
MKLRPATTWHQGVCWPEGYELERSCIPRYVFVYCNECKRTLVREDFSTPRTFRYLEIIHD